MSTLIVSFADKVDRLRAKILRITLSVELFRKIYCNRAHRLFFLYVLFILIALGFATIIPLWQLILGPLCYGFAHLPCSVRYFHHAVAQEEQLHHAHTKLKSYRFLLIASCIYCAYRIARSTGLLAGLPPYLSEWEGSAVLDAGFVILIFLGALWLYKGTWKQVLFGLCLFGPLTYFLWVNPYITVGILMLLHNFIAFFYWIHLTKSKQSYRFALGAFALFLMVNGLIFMGTFDPVYDLFTRNHSLTFAGISHLGLGRLIFPWTQNENLWLYALSAFAFGQSTHYFIWLKAIPDECHSHKIPTSFRQSYRLLGKDFGKKMTHALIYLIAASFLLWIFVNFKDARQSYFLIAGFHGYIEIAGLGFIAST